MNLKQMLNGWKTRTGIAGVLGVGILISGGCNTPQGRAFARNLAAQAVMSGVDEAVRGEIKKSQDHEDYAKNQRGGRRKFRSSSSSELDHDLFFVCNSIHDLNRNGYLDGRKEIFGYMKESFNLDKESLRVMACSRGRESVTLKSFTTEGELLGETSHEFEKWGEVHIRYTRPNYDPHKCSDFIDKVYLRGSGGYVLTASYNTGEVYRINLEIEKD
jgi:hypothetical protein